MGAADVVSVAPAIAARGGVARGVAAASAHPGRSPTAQKAPNRMAHPGRAGLAPADLVARKVPKDQRVLAAHSLGRRGCVAVASGGVAPSALATARGVGVAHAARAVPGAATKAPALATAPGVAAGRVAHGRAARGGDGLGRRPGRAGMMVMRNHVVRLVCLACLVRGARLGRLGREVVAGAGFPADHGVGLSGAARKDGVLVWDDVLVLAARGRACSSAVA
jgi:hypothetical protein